MSSIAILCNGTFPRKAYPLYLLSSADTVVCCDGAAVKYRKHFGKWPDVIVGDMDSLPEAFRKQYSGTVVKEEEQDYNDLTKAMRYVFEHYPEAEEIHILGATGMREDHTVGNLGLLMEYTRMFPADGRKVDMVSDYGTAFAVTDSCELHLGEGRKVSIFSADNSLRIVSEGLQWQTSGVVFDAWWKATLNRSTAPVVKLSFSHPSAALVIVD